MGKICLDELKKIELDILIYIDQVCTNNNLRYFLCGGTLLGAIRHKGFIPWDDDVDICMPRPDYDRFIEIMRQTDSKYKVLSPEQKDYYYTFSKVVDCETTLYECEHQPIDNMGVYVDIFPLEGMPSDQSICSKHFDDLNRLRLRINSFSFCKPKFRKNLIALLRTLYLYQKNKKDSLLKFQEKYEKLARQYHYDESEYVYATGGVYGRKDIFKRDLFLDLIKVEFEGTEFFAPQEFDAYLKQLYGDYMQLPPVEKRVSNHSYKAKYR